MSASGYVAAIVANLHRTPDAHSEMVTQAKMGETVEIVDNAVDGWLRVTTVCDGYKGFIPASEVRSGEWQKVARSHGETWGLATVRNLRANLYESPRVQGNLVATVPMGVKLAHGASSESGWLPVTLADGRAGYVQSGDLDLEGREWAWEEIPQLRESLVRTAQRFLGVPYLWGGTSAFGLDCSGLVQHVYGLHGVKLPRDANEQAEFAGTLAVKRDEIVPGDLIFFGNHTHVGMAVSHFQFVHATVYLDPVVQISGVDDPHWRERTDEIRRVQV